MIETQILIIGSGISGSSAAIHLARMGYQVLLMTSTFDPMESSTRYAQGGIVTLGDKDTPKLLYRDIIRAGDGLVNPVAAKILSEEGPLYVKEFLIKDLGIPFSLSRKGVFDVTMEAAHSRRRILHVTDATGLSIEEHLMTAIQKEKNITLLPGRLAVDLITRSHHSSNPLAVYDDPTILGVYALNRKKQQMETILAAKTILATGGIGHIYLHTTNPSVIRGDGMGMAYRANARLINMEYIQFHPTAFFHRDSERFLISESVRGEGAKLMNQSGHYFMKDYDPEMEDLAPRDVVARAIHEEMLRQSNDHVYLDLSFIRKKGIDIAQRFPTIYSRIMQYGIDITKEPIPVVPAAHYFCGGIKVDEWGQTNIKNLYAVGEVSCTGLHGANRLASTSLLEGLVWGIRSAKHINESNGSSASHLKIPKWVHSEIPPWQEKGLVEETDPALIIQDWNTLRTTMWNYAGIVRSQKRLERAHSDLEYLMHRVERFYKTTKLTDSLIGLRNSIQVSIQIIRSALRNPVSRGCHFRKS
jgi:L-aspartate oxidase